MCPNEESPVMIFNQCTWRRRLSYRIHLSDRLLCHPLSFTITSITLNVEQEITVASCWDPFSGESILLIAIPSGRVELRLYPWRMDCTYFLEMVEHNGCLLSLFFLWINWTWPWRRRSIDTREWNDRDMNVLRSIRSLCHLTCPGNYYAVHCTCSIERRDRGDKRIEHNESLSINNAQFLLIVRQVMIASTPTVWILST